MRGRSSVGREEMVLEGFCGCDSLARVIDKQLLNEVKELVVLKVSRQHVALKRINTHLHI